MEKRKSAGESSDREQKWDKVFNALVQLSQNLHKDRNVLEDRIKYLLDLKMEHKVESARAELLLGFKERERLPTTSIDIYSDFSSVENFVSLIKNLITVFEQLIRIQCQEKLHFGDAFLLGFVAGFLLVHLLRQFVRCHS